jgi:hypothetical protein
MSDHHEMPEPAADQSMIASRRRILSLGAAGAATVLSVRPALANTVGSVLTCTIPVPDPSHAGQYIDSAGNLVAPLTPNSFPPLPVPLKGQDVKNALGGLTLPGTSYSQSQAYMAYIRRLQGGQSGFTCFASLQMPGR